MAFLKLIVLLGLLTTLEVGSINAQENDTEETATVDIRGGLVPTIQGIYDAMLPISEQLNKTKNDANRNSISSDALLERTLSIFKQNENKLEEDVQDKSYSKLKHLVQTMFRGTIEGIMHIIRNTNSWPKLLFINSLIYFGLFLGYVPGLLTFIGYKAILKLSNDNIKAKISYTVLKSICSTIQKLLTKIYPNFTDYFGALVAQVSNRGLSLILNHIKKKVEFDYAT